MTEKLVRNATGKTLPYIYMSDPPLWLDVPDPGGVLERAVNNKIAAQMPGGRWLSTQP